MVDLRTQGVRSRVGSSSNLRSSFARSLWPSRQIIRRRNDHVREGPLQPKACKVNTPNRGVRIALGLLQDIFRDVLKPAFAVQLWDGTRWSNGDKPTFTLVLKSSSTVRNIFARRNELPIAEAYIYDDFDIEGDLSAVMTVADALFNKPIFFFHSVKMATRLALLPKKAPVRKGRQPAQLIGTRHSILRDRNAIAYHYNVSNGFFELWLDRQMIYSCGYFQSPADSIDQAQQQKLDYICRKLQLSPGDRFLDIGCGWGALVIHAASRYGVQARGITLSESQARFAKQRIEQAGLADRCRVDVLDYRELEDGEYDRIASVGMFEHVGEGKLREYFRRAWCSLRPGGMFLNHGIGFCGPRPKRRRPTFFDRYVFPDGELVPLSTALLAAEASGFEVLDVESLRAHYILTLQHWLSRLESQREAVKEITDEVTYRVRAYIWRLQPINSGPTELGSKLINFAAAARRS